MQFLTLQYVDPATYQIMGNLKIVTTGLLFRLFLRRRLSPLQWIALTLLMIGAATSQARQQDCCDAGVCYLHSCIQELARMPSPRAGWCAKLADFFERYFVQISTSATATFSAPVQVRPAASVTLAES